MAGGGGGEQELNLVPYLDIMVNLIIFLLVITAYIVEMRQAPVLVPGPPGPGTTGGEPPKAFLTLAVTSKGFAVLGSENSNVPAAQFDNTGGAYPFDKLTALMRQYHDSYELADNLVVAADRTVPYRVVVEVMDAVREDEKGKIFPNVTLAVAVAGN